MARLTEAQRACVYDPTVPESERITVALAWLAELRAIEAAARDVAAIAEQIPVVCDSPELAALEQALRGT